MIGTTSKKAVVFSLIMTATLAHGDTVELTAVEQNLRTRDLANLGAAMGINFVIFDYEAADSHCVSFAVEESDGRGFEARHEGFGLCGRSGPQRLTVQWQAQAEELKLNFMRYRRDVEQGGSVSGPTIAIPGDNASALRGIDPPAFSDDAETVLVHAQFGLNEGPYKLIKVLAELRPNPTGSIGTM